MSALSLDRSARGSAYVAAANGLERTLLRASARLELIAVHRIERRAAHAPSFWANGDETRRDAAAAAHMGLLPR